MFRSVRSISLTLGTKKMKNSCFGPECTISEVPKLWSIYSSPLDPKWCLGVFRSISLTLGTSKMKNSCKGLEYSISGYHSCEASILVHWTQNDVWECSEHFANPRHVKDKKLMCRAWMHYFGGTKVVKHPLLSIGPKMMFGSVSEHFANPRHVKDEKVMFRAWMHYFAVPKLWSIHSSPLDPKWCLGVFRRISLTLGTSKMKNSCVGPECTISGAS
jgi:hypothetical protein